MGDFGPGGYIRSGGAWKPLRSVGAGLVYPRNLSDLPGLASSTISFLNVTSGAANTKGAWLQLDAALSRDANMLILKIDTATAGANRAGLLDVGVGGAGAEVVVAANINVGSAIRSYLEIPCWMPSGSRVSIRWQCGITTINASPVPFFQYWPILGQPTMTTMGAVTATSKGTLLTAPGSLNTPGAWTTIQASTAGAYSALLPTFGINGSTAIAASADMLVDVGLGSAGNEVVIVEGLRCNASVNEELTWPDMLPQLNYVEIPAASRLSARYQRSNAAGVLDCCLHGIAA